MGSEDNALFVLFVFQSCECSGEQSEALPREEEERSETAQSLPGSHHSQVRVYAQPQRFPLTSPKRHLCDKGKLPFSEVFSTEVMHVHFFIKMCKHHVTT